MLTRQRAALKKYEEQKTHSQRSRPLTPGVQAKAPSMRMHYRAASKKDEPKETHLQHLWPLTPTDEVCRSRATDQVAPRLPSKWNASLKMPVFCDARQLAADAEWRRYLDWVYSESSLTYPVDTRSFAIFYIGPQLPRAIAEGAAPLSPDEEQRVPEEDVSP